MSQHAPEEWPSASSPLPTAGNYFSLFSLVFVCVWDAARRLNTSFVGYLHESFRTTYMLLVTSSINGSEVQVLSETYHGFRLWGHLAPFGWSMFIKSSPCLKRLQKVFFTIFALKYSYAIFKIPMYNYRAKAFFFHRIFFIVWSMLQQTSVKRWDFYLCNLRHFHLF